MSGSPALGDVRPNHRFDRAPLDEYLQRNLPEYEPKSTLQQFRGGQSNPTFLLRHADQAWVLRKKPPGKLLPSAHQIEREFRLYEALDGSAVPVPKVLLLCEDDAIIGTPFFIMEFVDGRVFADPMLEGETADAREGIYREMIRVLAALHQLDYQALGLQDFGKPGNYFARQTARWTKQYLAARTDDLSAMNFLIEWLPKHLPEDDTTSIVHGDFQLYNLAFAHEHSRCLAVLDWELSTLGHPLADLAYNCMKFHSNEPGWGVTTGDGIPTESDVLEQYCALTGRDSVNDWKFCLAFAFFRVASIVQGVYQRGLQGNASSARALEMKGTISAAAETACQIIRG